MKKVSFCILSSLTFKAQRRVCPPLNTTSTLRIVPISRFSPVRMYLQGKASHQPYDGAS
jgi:hypothetical protein